MKNRNKNKWYTNSLHSFYIGCHFLLGWMTFFNLPSFIPSDIHLVLYTALNMITFTRLHLHIGDYIGGKYPYSQFVFWIIIITLITIRFFVYPLPNILLWNGFHLPMIAFCLIYGFYAGISYYRLLPIKHFSHKRIDTQ